MSEEQVVVNDIIIVKNLIKQVKVNNGTLEILKSISFNVKQGQSIAIVGASGSGKVDEPDTLVKMVVAADEEGEDAEPEAEAEAS